MSYDGVSKLLYEMKYLWEQMALMCKKLAIEFKGLETEPTDPKGNGASELQVGLKWNKSDWEQPRKVIKAKAYDLMMNLFCGRIAPTRAHRRRQPDIQNALRVVSGESRKLKLCMTPGGYSKCCPVPYGLRSNTGVLKSLKIQAGESARSCVGKTNPL